jgi:uncharacterized lipoprotein YbaY
MAMLTGTVSYPPHAVPPPNAMLVIQLLELAPDGFPSQIGGQQISSSGAGPIPFTIAYDPTHIDPQQEYVIAAEILEADTIFVSWRPVLTRGHPASVDIVLQPLTGTIDGTISYPPQSSPPPEATITMRLLGPGHQVVEQVIEASGAGPFSFAFPYIPTTLYTQMEYVIAVEVRRQNQLLFVSEWTPVLTRGHPATLQVPLLPPSLVRGTIAYPKQSILPPGAVLTVQLYDPLDEGVGGHAILSEQIITPTTENPIPFALSAPILPQRTYLLEAWISAPGRLDWRAEAPYPVLTQGQPTMIEGRVAPPSTVATVSGTISYPNQPALPTDAVLTVKLIPRTAIANPYAALSVLTIQPVGPAPIPFILEYDPGHVDPQQEYIVYAELRAGQRLPLVAPPQLVLIGGADPLHLALQPPATIITIGGTVSFPEPLPADARLVLQISDAGTGDMVDLFSTLLVECVVAPVGSGPLSFGIELDPATLDPLRRYWLTATIYAGEQPLMWGDRAIYAAAPYLPPPGAMQVGESPAPIDLHLEPRR